MNQQARNEGEEIVTLHASGPIPGIPGDHGPGAYRINWQTRTITPINAGSPVVESKEITVPPEAIQDAQKTEDVPLRPKKKE